MLFLCLRRNIPKYPFHYLSLSRRVREDLLDLRASHFWKSFLETFSVHRKGDFQRIVCLGLGQFGSCHIARIQLALLLGLKEEFGCFLVEAFDPAFSETERETLAGLEIVLLEKNTEGKHKVSSPTLLYLPHCPKQLTNNLLWSNWSEEGLSNLFLVGNSIKNVCLRTLSRILKENARYIQSANEFVKETELEFEEKYSEVFNDLSLHSFPDPPEQDWPGWRDDREPQYEESDLEFVKDD